MMAIKNPPHVSTNFAQTTASVSETPFQTLGSHDRLDASFLVDKPISFVVLLSLDATWVG
jgi:hypothetical protein